MERICWPRERAAVENGEGYTLSLPVVAAGWYGMVNSGLVEEMVQ